MSGHNKGNHIYGIERQKCLVYLTNNVDLTVETMAMRYKSRWNIELFFKNKDENNNNNNLKKEEMLSAQVAFYFGF
ncbi:MAG: transposase [Desulfatiglans sp.]|nr:transposase [Desulfatiglans sp.]